MRIKSTMMTALAAVVSHVAVAAPADEVATASAFAAASCTCMFEHYDAVHESKKAMELCITSAAETHGVIVPTGEVETVMYKVEGASMTVPKLFEAKEANLAYATGQNQCMLSLSQALMAFQQREWTDAICMSQCREEGEKKKMCTGVCLAAQLPSTETESPSEGDSTPAAQSCEEQCAHLDGRSRYACTRTCEKNASK